MAMERNVAAELLAWGVWDLPEDDLDIQQLKTGYLTARAVSEAFLAEVARLRQSNRYSPSGLAGEIRALAREQLARLDAVQKDIVDARRQKLEGLENEMAPQVGPTVVEAMRELEIRTLLLNQPRDSAMARLRAAAAQDDLETLTAVLRAPMLFKERLGLDARLLEEFRRELFEARCDPEALKRHRLLVKALDLANQALASARSAIKGLAGGQDPEPSPEIEAEPETEAEAEAPQVPGSAPGAPDAQPTAQAAAQVVVQTV